MNRARATSVGLFLAIVLAGGCLRRGVAPTSGEHRQAPATAPDGKALRSLGYTSDKPAAGAVPAEGEAANALATMAASLKLIRTAQTTLDVPNYGEAAQALERLAQSLGGYVADSQAQRDSQGHEQGTLVLRVPAEHFGQALAGAAQLGTMRSQNVGTQDVTKAYVDLETRLRVKRDAAERLREILRARTARLADVLEAERELSRVVGEIEQAEGERRFYDQQLALSTLTVELREPRAPVESGAFDALGEAWSRTCEVLASSLAVMVYALAALAPWVLVGLGLWRALRAWRARL